MMKVLIWKTSWHSSSSDWWVERSQQSSGWHDEQYHINEAKEHLYEQQKEYPNLKFKIEVVKQEGRWDIDLPKYKVEHRVLYCIIVKLQDFKQLISKHEVVLTEDEESINVDYEVELVDDYRE